MSQFLDKEGLSHFIDKLINRQVQGRGLSTEDFTTELKEKLDNLSENSGGSDIDTSNFLTKYDVSITPSPNKIAKYDTYSSLYFGQLRTCKLTATINSNGWYTVYDSLTNDFTTSDNILLNISRNCTSLDNEGYSFTISVGYNNKISITQLSGIYNQNSGNLIDKIRVLTKNNKPTYIEIHYNGNSINSVGVVGIGAGRFYAPQVISKDLTDYTITEFETSNGFRKDNEFIVTPTSDNTELLNYIERHSTNSDGLLTLIPDVTIKLNGDFISNNNNDTYSLNYQKVGIRQAIKDDESNVMLVLQDLAAYNGIPSFITMYLSKSICDIQIDAIKDI